LIDAAYVFAYRFSRAQIAIAFQFPKRKESDVARREVTEELRYDLLVDIPRSLQRRFGTTGKMLKPSLASVTDVVAEVPCGTVLTIIELPRRLAARHGAQTACPFLTKRALMAISEDPRGTVPYWRIVRANGAMMDYFPGGPPAQAERLAREVQITAAILK
jgi:alkylated DNA nucleotide flippase Atl1